MRDICVNCGQTYPQKLWGALCNCTNPMVVHRMKCTLCDNKVGYMIDDDYCGPEFVICSQCLGRF